MDLSAFALRMKVYSAKLRPLSHQHSCKRSPPNSSVIGPENPCSGGGLDWAITSAACGNLWGPLCIIVSRKLNTIDRGGSVTLLGVPTKISHYSPPCLSGEKCSIKLANSRAAQGPRSLTFVPFTGAM